MSSNPRPTPSSHRSAARKPLKILAILIGIVVLLFAGVALFIRTLDADKYRPQIIQMLSEKTGRKVELNGPISFSLGFSGVRLSLRDAGISNPPWASRADLAGMGRFDLGVELWPLLDRRLSITDVYIENADILLETNSAGQKNWDLRPASAPKAATQRREAGPAEEREATLSIDHLRVVNSQIAFRNPEGKTTSISVQSLSLGMKSAGAKLTVRARVNDVPLTVDVNAGIRNLLSKEAFGFDATAEFSGMKLTSKGTADLEGRKATIAAFDLSAGDSRLNGKGSATWSGPRPKIRADVTADQFNPKDFAVKTAARGSETPASSSSEAATPASQRLFSDAPLPVDGLRAVDAEGTVKIGSLVMGKTSLTDVATNVALSGGNLVLAPAKASLGAKPVDFQLKLDASRSPAHLAVGVMANDIELAEVLRLINVPGFIKGQGSMEVQLSGDGNSPHAIASSLGGVVNVLGQRGQILTGTAARISDALMTLLNAGGGDAVNCLAVRFIARSGVLSDNGILLDSAASTVAGAGNINLGAETINLVFSARPKIANIGGLTPSFKVGGTLTAPKTSVDAQGAVKNVIGSFLGGSGFGSSTDASGVPAMQTPPAGENACLYTLNHPQTGSQPSILPATPGGRIEQKIQDLGNGLLKGILGQ